MGLPERGLALLAPFVRPRKVLTQPASNKEKAEYVICLQRLGSINEAASLSVEIDETEAPEILLYRSILHFSQWNYAEGLPPLIRLVESHASAEPYLIQAARVNMAAAWIHLGRFEEAIPLLESLAQATHGNGEWLLHCNVLQLMAQNHVLAGNYGKAEEALDRADKLLMGIKTVDRLLLIKWRALLAGFRSGRPDMLEPAREEARRKKHWETLRDLDFYGLRIAFDEKIFLKLYFGTLSSYFRARLVAAFPSPVPDEVAIAGGWSYVSPVPPDSIDPLGELSADLAPGTVTHAALMLLLSDSYKAFRSGEIHSTLFPGDFFNPDTSLNRVHQALHRTRDALSAQIPGLEIVADEATYRLRINAQSPLLKWNVGLVDFSPVRIRLELLKRACPAKIFGSVDVQKVFGISRSAANKLLLQWRESAWVEPAGGEQRQARYSIKV